MAEETKTYVFGQEGGILSALAPLLSSRGIDPSYLALLNNNGGFSGGGGWFMWVIFLFFLMGWGGNGFGGGFGGGNGTGFLANQLNNDAGRDLLLQAINGNGSAISQLATTLNSDINAVQGSLNALSSAIQSVGSSVGMGTLQTINAIQSGDASLASQLAQCCCDNRLLTTQQGYEAQLRTIEQTNQLGSQADRNTEQITGAIADLRTQMTAEFCAVREREMQDKIDSLTSMNSTLRSQIDNANQTAAVANMLSPIQKEIAEIRAAQPATTTVQYPQLTAIPSWYLYGNGSYGGYYPYYGTGSIWA